MLLDLRDERATDASRSGAKAATLARLLRAGLPVLPGIVIPADTFADGRLPKAGRADLVQRASALGERFAVRSSGSAEDLPDSSAAGLYLTLLAVEPSGLVDAAERVHASGDAPAVQAYRQGGVVSVLVQRMLQPLCAGVAFAADPVSGDRETTVVHAVKGQGERLVAGRALGETWRVRGTEVARQPGDERAIDEAQAAAVAALVREVSDLLGEPQDVEWAYSGSSLHLLQARPMTALPDLVTWDTPPGAWARNLRLGEWLGAPVSPLFESWLLTAMEETMHGEYARLVGQPAPRPLHVVVNGWYYYSLAFLPVTPTALARMLPGLLVRLARHPRRVAPVLPPLARFGIDHYVREWREALLPGYVAATDGAAAAVGEAPPQRLVEMVDALGVWAGRYFTSMTFVAGYAWKTEIPFARFWRTHLAGRIRGHPQALLRGLVRPATLAHAVQSLDWALPTLGELGLEEDAETDSRQVALGQERSALETAARSALDARRVRQFEVLLHEAQRAAVLREAQIAEFTRAWPVMRLALTRIGDGLAAAGVIADGPDVYFLRRSEVLAAIAGDRRPLTGEVSQRRRVLARQARLPAPLMLGQPPRMLSALLEGADRALRDDAADMAEGLRGTPASPGRATGRARVIRSTDEFDRIQPGDVLVCPLTAPAWASLFRRVAAVVTDVGSPAAHASILAREYGIPAVVGTGDGTSQIQDGWLVTVDGGAGIVSW
jgi:pyruvate,water dikinase